MQFFSALSLLWILPTAGLVTLLYVLKLRRKDVVVSSTFLWRQVIRDVQANAPFQKLRKNLMLFLQLLTVLLLVLSVARPFWRGKAIGGRYLVALVDNSASMMATDVGPSRLEEAKKQAAQLVREIRPEDQMMILTCSSRPEAMSGFSDDKSDLIRRVEGIRPRQTNTNMRDALNLAAALVASRDASQIDIVSDGSFPNISSVNLGKTRVVFHPVGKTGHNVGIAAVDYRRSLTGDKTLQLFVTAHNFDTVPRKFNIELLHDGTTVDAHEVNLAPGGEDPDIFELPEPSKPLAITIRIDAKDDLQVDNEAAVIINPSKPIKTLLVTADNVFLEEALKADPTVNLNVIKPSNAPLPTGYDVTVFDTVAPPKLPNGNYMFVDCVSDQAPADPGKPAEWQSIVDASHSHPTMRYVEFGALLWTSVKPGKPRGWGQEIATTELGAAVVAGEKGRNRSLWTGFQLDLAHGKFVNSVAFPIFMTNAVRWLARADDDTSSQVRTGGAITITTPLTGGKLTIARPDGSKKELAINDKGAAIFDDTDQIGVYRATGANGYEKLFAANLADYAESDIAPRKNPDVGGNAGGSIGKPVTVVREIWPWLAVLLLGLLGLEWWAFHRRVFVSG
ncbi:MAG: VWA domain-containing protein [Chthonomonadales bacterium]